jgi:uncharacterized membrane protein (DUF4010 family)
LDRSEVLGLLAAVTCGLLIGVERGWRQRNQADGTRVAGVRTFTLIGGAGGLVAVIASAVSAVVAAVSAAATVLLIAAAFLGRKGQRDGQRDATTMVAAIVTFLLGVVAASGQAKIAVAGAALAALVLASRQQSHRFIQALAPEELQALVLFAGLSLAVLPFLPDSDLGPYAAWNPFRLWLVVILIIGFSVAGYVANRVFGENRGTVATALIGGAYSSTAVTASLSAKLRAGDPGPLATGIALASAVMYVRVLVLAFVLVPRAGPELALVLAPASAVAWIAAAVTWRCESSSRAANADYVRGKPFRLLPALGFAAACAGAALLVRWAQHDFGEMGGAWSLFLAGSFDVDAAIVALSTLPSGSIADALAAVALGGTVAVNMAFKIAVAVANAGFHAGRKAALALAASEATLIATLAWQFARLSA